MTALPAASDFTGAGVTEAGFKTALTDLRAFLATLLDDTGTPADARAALGVLAAAGDAATGLLRLNQGANIASGTTVDLGAATGNYLAVTHAAGTTAIGSLGGASLEAGTQITVHFAISGGTLTLTHNATSLVLPTGASITLATGDVAEFTKIDDASAYWRCTAFTRASGQPLATAASTIPTGSLAAYGGRSAPSGWLLCDGTAVSRATYADLFAALVATSTVTMTIASPCVVSWTAHGLSDNDPVKFSTTGALPTGLTAGTTYYVKAKTADTFQLAATPGGTAKNTSGSQSGTHTAVSAPYGDGDGSTTFNTPDLRGRAPWGRDDMGGSAAGRVTSAGAGIKGNVMGETGGAQTVTLTTAELPAHTHTSGFVNAGTSSGSGTTTSSGVSDGSAVNTGSAGSGGAHNNMPPVQVAQWIVKT